MRKIFTLIALFVTIAMNAQDNPQITNGDFEDWSSVNDNNHAPNSWNSFETAEGTWASTVKAQQVTQSDDVRPGSTGKSSAKIYSRAVKLFGTTIAVAQGNLTTGCINAGSTTATAKENYNFSKTNDATKSMRFTGKPTAMKVWVKLVQQKVDEKYPTARISAVIHDAHDYITYGLESNDTEANKSYVVAKGEQNFTSNGGEWQQIIVPFDYDSYTNDDPQYIIINFSTNSYPGKGNEGDELYVDDIEMVYEEETTAPLYANTFTDNMVVIINGNSSEPMPTSIEFCEQPDGKYLLSLQNFILVSGEDIMPVGTIIIKDLEPSLGEDNLYRFDAESNIMIENGNMEGVDMWMGPLICSQVGSIPITLHATLSSDWEELLADIDIDLTAALGQKIKVLFGQSLIDATGINNISTTTSTSGIYDVNGRKVINTNHGLYIVKTTDGKVKKLYKK